ncbi:MAG: cysteine hydrolase [Nitrososphaerota archaeon]|jgi:nicotinamidase-related amidase|nr:cysteine hydrolase [Nitrososphaerota archaeon]MDG6967513.1 cysteine hydrolase [Nitrososphaerota archaeon]MDG6978942.1 cysteine hydrolase [Nitrososphaerota archaeon]MDG7005604.1 cysteine hydrolase [Nitrososphaerota archaeon]MDG7020776.1 cysteine hydrolase [Nitrososphaerota archaeon]
MPSAHGHGKEGRATAELEAAAAVYPPSSFKPPKVYEKDRRRAVLVVDMVEDFVYGVLRCERMVPKIPNVAAVLDASRASGVPVVYCNDSHKPSDFELNRWEAHAMRGTKGAQVIPELAPRKGDHVVPKSTYSSFQATELDDVLRGLYGGRGANTLVIAGVTTDCCVRHTAADAFFRRYETEVVEDGVEAFSEVQHRVGLQYVRYWYLCGVTGSRDLVRRLR